MSNDDFKNEFSLDNSDVNNVLSTRTKSQPKARLAKHTHDDGQKDDE